MKDIGWFSQAICSGKTELFFPAQVENSSVRRRRERLAAIVCNQCPVKQQCREYARENDELGFWGGETEEQRYLAGYLQSNKFMRRRKYTRGYSQEILDQFNEREKTNS